MASTLKLEPVWSCGPEARAHMDICPIGEWNGSDHMRELELILWDSSLFQNISLFRGHPRHHMDSLVLVSYFYKYVHFFGVFLALHFNMS